MQKKRHDVPPRFAWIIITLVTIVIASIVLGAREVLRALRRRKRPVASNGGTKGNVADHSSHRNWLGIAGLLVALAGVVVPILLHFWR